MTPYAELRLYNGNPALMATGQIPLTIALPSQGRLVLGRSAKADVVLSALKDGKFIISRQHAVIQMEKFTGADGGASGMVIIRIEDCNSLNGLFVNDTRVQNQILQHNDIIQLGGMADVPFGGVLQCSDVSVKYKLHVFAAEEEAVDQDKKAPPSQKKTPRFARQHNNGDAHDDDDEIDFEDDPSAQNKRQKVTTSTTPVAVSSRRSTPTATTATAVGATATAAVTTDAASYRSPHSTLTTSVTPRLPPTRTPIPAPVPALVVSAAVASTEWREALQDYQQCQRREMDELRRRVDSLTEALTLSLVRPDQQQQLQLQLQQQTQELERLQQTLTSAHKEQAALEQTIADHQRALEQERERHESQWRDREVAWQRDTDQRVAAAAAAATATADAIAATDNDNGKGKGKGKGKSVDNGKDKDSGSQSVPTTPTANSSHCLVDLHTLRQQLTCTLCQNLFVNAVVLHCSHAFCRHCLESHLHKDTTSTTCPICCDPTAAAAGVPHNQCLYFPSMQLDELSYLFVEASTVEERQAYEAREQEARATLLRFNIDVDGGGVCGDSATNLEKAANTKKSTKTNAKAKSKVSSQPAERVQCAFCGERGHTEEDCPNKRDEEEDGSDLHSEDS
jgi:pSer/pThr/pTyr-binding forkhead associated (FHA) protein